MKKQMAFVLGGGGARGALQVGALHALLEHGYIPDLLVGTSIGAVNAAFLALRGVQLGSVEALSAAWRDASQANLLPSNYLWLTVRTLFKRPASDIPHRMREFFLEHGLNPDLTFGDIRNVRLYTVSADLNNGKTILHGLDPRDSILEAVLASTTLPPWVQPLQKDGRLLIDGGVVSNLPIEPALAAGATEIIALDLFDPRDSFSDEGQSDGQNQPGGLHRFSDFGRFGGPSSFGPFLRRLLGTVEERQTELELSLASACSVPVLHIRLRGETCVPLWDFHCTEDLVLDGYKTAKRAIAAWREARLPRWKAWLKGQIRRR